MSDQPGNSTRKAHPVKLNIINVFLIVTGASLAGMVLAGVFGYGAAHLAPQLFETLVPWTELEPTGTATVLGAMVGVLLGGGLGVFTVLVQLISSWVTSRRNPKTA